MAEDAEMIGGIKVSAEVTDAGIDQQLTKIEGKLRTAAEKWQGMLNLHVTATGPTTAGGTGGAAPGRPAPSITEQLHYPKGGARGGGGAPGTGISGPDVQNAYERAVSEALAAEQARGQKSVNAVQQATQKQRDVTVEKIQATQPPPVTIPVEVAETPEIVAPQAPKPVTVPVEVAKTSEITPPEAPAPVQVSVDDAGARSQLDEFITYLKAQVASANEAAVIKPQVDIEPAKEQAAQAPAAPATQRATRRRKPEPEPEVYSVGPEITDKERALAAASTRQQELVASSRRAPKEAPPSVAEAALLDALEAADAPEEPQGNQPGRLQFVDQLEKQRRDEARGKGEGPLDINRVEASLNKQRLSETEQAQNEADQRRLVELSYERQQEAQELRPSLSMAPPASAETLQRRQAQQQADAQTQAREMARGFGQVGTLLGEAAGEPITLDIKADTDEANQQISALQREGMGTPIEVPVQIDQRALAADLARVSSSFATATGETVTTSIQATTAEGQRRMDEILAQATSIQEAAQGGAEPPQGYVRPVAAPDVRARNSETLRRQTETSQAAIATERALTGAVAGASATQQRTGGKITESMQEFVEKTNARRDEAIQRELAGIAASGRTGQVAISGISATRFGTRAEQIRATQEQRAARAIAAQAATRLRRDPNDVEAGEAFEQATARIAQADQRLANLQGIRSTAKNLAAIAFGALVFSRAMSALDPVLQAGVSALGDWVDMQTGFASKSTAFTSALAQQTIAQKGNVDAVLAQAEATAGLTTQASDYLNTSLKLTAQVKAGALAQQQASDLFRAGAGAQPTQGLGGGFGGVLGTSLFAQQLGGGKGFAEIIAGDIANFGGNKASISAFDQAIATFDRGVTFLVDEGFRNFVLEEAKAQGSQLPAVAEGVDRGLAIAGQINPLTVLPNLLTGNFDPIGTIQRAVIPPDPNAPIAPQRGTGAQFNPLEGIDPENIQRLNVYMGDLNSAAVRGAEVLGDMGKATIGFAKAGAEGEEEIRRATMAAIAANNDYALSLAQESRVVIRFNGEVADTAEELNQGLQQMAVGKGIPDIDQLGRLSMAQERQRQREAQASIPAMRAQFAYERPAVIAAAEREQEFALNTQLPAQAALSALAQPNLPIGTGIVAANADEQERIRDAAKETTDLQEKLNSYYDIGKQILLDTYQIPPALINSIQAVGQQIAATQAGIRNEQAAFQVAQYNNQLRIARRSLADIGGLTGRNFGAGQSYLGMLEKQNLALSRQAQLMQFGMQQRQINFQVALAGFEAPGVTPEERQARVKEAEIEAGFAQKQLNIQRQMFGNQVQIVDIQNLRQGVDLAAQINLLLQGRQVTIDTAAAEERLVRLQQLQALQVAEAGTYIEKVNKLTGRAFSEIQALETAAGEAMIDAGAYALENFGITLDRMTEEFLERTGQTPLGTSEGLGGIVGGMMPESVRKEVEVILNTANAQKQLEGINEQQIKISENVGEYLGDVTRTVTRTSRQVNRLEGAVGDALGRATTAQVNALYTYFTAAAEQWTSFFATVAKTAGGGGGTDYYGGSDKPDKSNAAGFVGMTTGTTMTGAGVMGEAGQEAYAILRNPKQLLDFGTGGGGGGNVTIIFNGPVIREEQDMDKIAAKVMAATGREAALRGLRSVS